MGKNSVTAKNIVRKKYAKTTFDTILYLTKNVTFPEDSREFQVATDMVTDETVDLLQSRGILTFAQEPSATTIITGKITTNAAADHLVEEVARLDDLLTTDHFILCVDNDGFTNAQLVELAKFVETQEYMVFFLTNEDGVKDAAVDTDLASMLLGLNLRHSAVWMHHDSSLDLAVASRFLGEKIGLVNTKFLPLSGLEITTLTSTQTAAIEAKNCNYYGKERKKYDFTKQGVTCSGEPIKSIAGELWLNVRSIESIYEALLNESNISFNSEDIEIIVNKVEIVLAQGQKQKIIAKNIGEKESFVLTITEDRAGQELSIEIKYLEAGSLKWVTLTFIAYKDDNDFNLIIKAA